MRAADVVAESTPVADLVIVGAKIWTGTGLDATAVAVVGERIAAVGDDAAIRKWAGPKTRIIEADGRRVLPGLIDSHLHIVSGGQQLARLNLRSVASQDEFIEAVGKAVLNLQPSGTDPETAPPTQQRWLLGGRWSVESWENPVSPRKEWIDPGSPETPVFLSRMDGHQALANSAALLHAGIDRNGPPDPPGGDIERDPDTNEPTGILKDTAMNLVADMIPAPSDEAQGDAMTRAMHHLNAQGITCVHDVSGREDLPVLLAAHRDKRLTVRVRKYLSVSDWISVIDQVQRFPADDTWLSVVGFKGYMDGSLGSRTAYMYQSYADTTEDSEYPSGLLIDMADPPKKLRHMIERVDAAGLQCAIHAIGDEANHILLNMYEAVGRRNGPRDRRFRIEHAQHLLPEDIARFGELGVIASMQPLHKADDGRYAEAALGEEQLAGSYAFRSLNDSGALLAFGSDWPVVSCDPFAGMAAAVTGRTLDGKIWLPAERIGIEDALRAYTINAAQAAFLEEDLGTIETGKLADFVMLSQDVLRVPSDDIADTKNLLTVVGGQIVFDVRESANR